MSGAYITELPSTPQMQRYTSTPSNYVDPSVSNSPTNPWGSSLSGCSSCGLGLPGDAGPAVDPNAAMIKIGIGALAGAIVLKRARFTGAIIGALAGHFFG
jgi:hypothetical protein